MKVFSITAAKNLCLLVILSLCSLAPNLARADWQKIGSFPWEISCVNFISSEVGFVGLGSSPGLVVGEVGIYKTTDGGTTWIQAVIPQGYTGEVCQILMLDETTGWAAVAPYMSSGNIGLWRTVDGGLSWTETGLPSALTSLYQTSSTLVATDIYGRGHLSFDSGRTWKGSFISSTNCVDFVDDQHGLISDFRGQNWLVTNDGGRTWFNANMNTESWSVYGVKGRSIFYAAPEGPSDGTPYTTEILRSTDYGMNWNVVHRFDFRSTGTIRGVDESVLYIQTEYHANQEPFRRDFYRSVDQGATWTNIGGPGAYNDTRFMVYSGACGGDVLYAFDSVGGLYRFVDNTVQPGIDMVKSQSFGTKHAAANSMVSVPVGLSIQGSHRLLDTMKINEIDYSLVYNGTMLDIDPKHLVSRITAPAGWTIKSATISLGQVNVALLNTNSQTLTNVLQLGSILFDTYSGNEKNTLVTVATFVIKTAENATYHYCSGFEGDYLGLIVIDGAGVPSIATGSDVSIYPNPLTHNADLKLKFDLQRETRVKAEVFDLLGHKMLAHPDYSSTQTLAAGHREIELNTQALSAGVYYVRLDCAGVPVTKQFTVIR